MLKSNLDQYKEILIKRTESTHLFCFEFQDLKGFYVLDGDQNKWLSCDLKYLAGSGDKKTKFFDLEANGDQIITFLLPNAHDIGENPIFSDLLDIILCNTRQGTPRKFLVSSDTKEKVSIQFPISNPMTWEI